MPVRQPGFNVQTHSGLIRQLLAGRQKREPKFNFLGDLMSMFGPGLFDQGDMGPAQIHTGGRSMRQTPGLHTEFATDRSDLDITGLLSG